MRTHSLLYIVFAICTSSLIAQERLAEPPLDAQSQAFVNALADNKSPGFHELTPVEARQAFASLTNLFGIGPDDVMTEDRTFGDTPVRIYRPKAKVSKAALPAILFFHGGGWVLGSIETHDALCRRLCSETQAAVISVDYRLAPEHPFPLPLDDCFAATDFAAKHASELGLDAERIVVAGDSAGGNLAAAVALKARDLSGPKLRAQVLIYPAMDSECNTESYSNFAEGYGLTKQAMFWYWKQYLGDGPANIYASPSKAHTLTGLPETILITSQYDVLRDEGELYAKKLREAGIEVSQRRYAGVVHGFVHFAGALEQGKTATTDLAKHLRHIFEMN
jgi:acetyl esterase